MQAFVVGAAEVDVAAVGQIERPQQEVGAAGRRLFGITVLQLVAHLHQTYHALVFAQQQVAQMACHALNEILGVEALVDDLIQQQQHGVDVAGQNIFNHPEIVLIIKHIEVGDNVFVSNVVARETHHLVEDGKGVAQGSVGLLRYDVESLFLGVYTLFGGYILQMLGDVLHRDALEVENLAS